MEILTILSLQTQEERDEVFHELPEPDSTRLQSHGANVRNSSIIGGSKLTGSRCARTGDGNEKFAARELISQSLEVKPLQARGANSRRLLQSS